MRRGRELLDLPAGPAGPFGEEPEPWYKRGSGGAPRRYAVPVGLASPILAGWAASDQHGVMRFIVGIVVVVLPSWALDSWWRGRQRSREERLFPEPESRFLCEPPT